MAPLKLGFMFACGASAALQTKKAEPVAGGATAHMLTIPLTGQQLARVNSTVNPTVTCPTPWGWPSPPDGLGQGPLLVSMATKGLPKSDKSCGKCGPKCQKILDVLTPAFKAYENGDEGAELFRYATPNLHHSTTGFGGTTHACFGHTYQGTVEVAHSSNNCYTHGARIGHFFKPTATDIIVSSCGDRATVNLHCNCHNSAGNPYPQSYSWLLHLQDAPWLDAGFQFWRINAVLDSELTLETSIRDIDLDPYMCPLLHQPLHPIAKLPEPSFYKPVETPPTPSSTCEECPHCDSRFEKIQGALKAAVAGDVDKIFGLMSDDVEFYMLGAGPTKSGCFAEKYTGHDELRKPLKRLQSMVASFNLINMNLMIDSCGKKFNAYLIFDVEGKSSFRYTFTTNVVMYLEDKDSDDFAIKFLRTTDDTEVLMNMAEREKKFDSSPCDLLGDWSESVTHTVLQP